MSVMQLEINEVTRDITPDDRTSFVEKDVNVDTVRLALPVGFSDLTIGSGAAMRVMYIRPGESQVRAATASLTESNGLFHFFDWHLTAADLEKEGPLQMAVCLVEIGEDGETKTSDWNTKIYSIQIHGGLHTDRGDEEDPDIDASVAEQIAAMNQAIFRSSRSEAGMLNITMVMTPMPKVPILTQGMNCCPFLKRNLSTTYPKSVSLIASHT